jgi:tetratricopeptide (TPR) repeat protein
MMTIKNTSKASWLPKKAMRRLQSLPPWVVAPVGVGYQVDLVAWGEAHGYQVGSSLEGLRPPALWLPSSRSQLLGRAEGLVEGVWLSEAELTWERGEWEEALEAYPETFRKSTYQEAEGWPLGLALAREIGQEPLSAHPLVLAKLVGLVPEEVAEAVLKAAKAPVLVPILWSSLGLSPEEVHKLWDKGLLVPREGGVALPTLLRRAFLPFPDPDLLKDLGKRLWEGGFGGAALLTYLEAGLMEEALKAALLMDLQEEASLQGFLARVPPAWHAYPLYGLLAGRLARKKGEIQMAQAFLETAERDPGLEPWRQLELGLLHVGRGEVEAAEVSWSKAYRLASQPLLRAKAAHNLAGLLVLRGEHQAAEAYLEEAVGIFRTLAREELQGESLALLALSYQVMGRLREAYSLYREALDLLARHGRPTGLLWANLAELYLLQGELHRAREALDQADEDPKARGVALLNRAWMHLLLGEMEAAEALLHRSEAGDLRLAEEWRLLLARMARFKGQREEALAHLQGLEDLRADLERALLGALDPEALRERALAKGARLEAVVALLLLGRVEEALPWLRAEGYGLFGLDPDLGDLLRRLSEGYPELRSFLPLRIQGIGPFRVCFAGKHFLLSDFPTRKTAALLVLLALEPQGWWKGKLGEKLWSEAANPEGSVAQALYLLNQLFQTRLCETHRGVVRLLYPVELDLVHIGTARNVGWTSQPILPELADLLPDEVLVFEARRARWLAQLKRDEAERFLLYLENLILKDPLDTEAREVLAKLYRQLGYEKYAQLHEKRLDASLS